MMDRSVLRFKYIIENTRNINTCIKALNLDISSSFLCFLKVLEDAICNYRANIDYSYIEKVSNYLERVYEKLSIKQQNEYSSIICKIRKIYRRQIQNIDTVNKNHFERVIINLGSLIKNYIQKNDLGISDTIERESQDDEYIITIDDTNAKVLDDGLSIRKLENGNLCFKVHIADPLVLYPYESEIMKKAKSNVETIYLADDSIPMIPDSISYEKLSLTENRNRFGKTFCYEFDTQGNIVNFYIQNCFVKISEKHSYESMNELYKNGGNTQEEDSRLAYYDQIVTFLRTMFKDAKSYEEIKIKELIDSPSKRSSFSENLVSHAMILTGYMTAKYMREKGLPYVYRCHEFKSIDKTIQDSMSKEELIKLQQALSHSYYSRTNKGHQGLNVEQYSHVTSPLRRFCDDLNMYSLDTCYFKTPSDQDIYKLEEEIDKTCQYMNEENPNLDEETKVLIKKNLNSN